MSDGFIVGNPRVLLWLKAHGLKQEDIQKEDPEEVRRIAIDGDVNLWTIHYSFWITDQWHRWAESLGFKGEDAHRKAMRAGHFSDSFDVWLRSVVEDKASLYQEES